jgi:lipid A 3-O-deacylase
MKLLGRHTARILFGLVSCLGATPMALAFDSASIEFGTGNRTLLTRIGLQSKWESRWWQSNGTHIGGSWDATLMQWHSNRYQDLSGATQNITAVGITPIFRFQRDTMKGAYVEAGIGAHYFSDIYDNNRRRFSTHFQFGDHIGVGYVFGNGVDLSLKIQHFSNGGIKQPNNGANFLIVGTSYPF